MSVPNPIIIDAQVVAQTNVVNAEALGDGAVNAETLTDNRPMPHITIGEVQTLATGEDATATMTGDYINPVLNLGLPRGEQGIQGVQGERGIQGIQGIQGEPGRDGSDGQDGFSPTATVSKSGDTTTITITDKDGTTTATVKDGANGADGKPGIIYTTCSTNNVTAIKEVSAPSVVEYFEGLSLRIKFAMYCGVVSPKLKVNNLDPKDIVRQGTTQDTMNSAWQSGEAVDMVYDGERFVIVKDGLATTTQAGAVMLNSSTNSSAEWYAATPKAVKAAYDLASSKITAPQSPSNGQELIYVNGEWIAEDSVCIVNLVPQNAGFSGVMDKTVGQIYEEYQLGKRIFFRVWTSQTDYMEVECTARWTDGAFAYPSFNAYIFVEAGVLPFNAVVYAFTSTTDNADKDSYGAVIYQQLLPYTDTRQVLVNKDGGGWSAESSAPLTASIPYGEVDNTSTSTAFTATVPGITELRNGVCMLLKNGVVTSASGFTINVNNLGAKPAYSNMATGNDTTPTAPTRETTLFNINYTILFVYSEDIATGGGWVCYRGYYSDANSIGYQLRTNSYSRNTVSRTRYYRLLFSSADDTQWVPANTTYDNSATSVKPVNTTPINPHGEIAYLGNSTNYAVGAGVSSSAVWQQYAFSLGYSFNTTGAALTLTSKKPVYVKCAPQTNGSAIIDSTTPIVQALPSTADGKIYIFLGMAYSATNIEMTMKHPIYHYYNGAIRLWTGPV